MTYNDFCDVFRSEFCGRADVPPELVKFYPDGWRGSGSRYDSWLIRDTNKHYQKEPAKHLQGDYLMVAEQDEDLPGVTRFSLDIMHKIFEQKGWDAVWDFVDWSMRYMQEHSVSDLLGSRTRYEDVKDRLMIRVMNYQINKTSLKHAIFRQFGDTALVLYGASRSDPSMCTVIKIPDHMPEQWGVEEQTIFDEALKNTFCMFPPRLHNYLHDVFHDNAKKGLFMEPGVQLPQIDTEIVSFMATYPNTNGAIAIFYPGVKERVAEIMGGSYYAAFLDAYTIVLEKVGENHDPKKLKGVVRSMAKHTAPVEVISKNVYLYDTEKGELEMMEI